MAKAGHRLKLTQLTSAGLDSRWRGARLFTRAAKGWEFSRLKGPLVLDLSTCVEASLPGAARAAVVLDRAVRDGISVEVVRPALGVRRSELAALKRRGEEGADISHSIRSSVISRYQCELFLLRIGFYDALSTSHLRTAGLRVTRPIDLEDFSALPSALQATAGALDSERAQAESEVDERYLVPAAFRLRWISALDRGSIHAALDELVIVMSQGDAGLLTPDDASGIASTVLFEALDNVAMHARRDGGDIPALLGAAFVQRADDDSGLRESRLDLVLADSGIGLVTTLGPHYKPSIHDRFLDPHVRLWPNAAKTIVWAFHPMSTSRTDLAAEPPVRGLSRTRQQAAYHRGRLRIRTGTDEIAWDFNTGKLQPHQSRTKAALWPGTVLELALPVGRAARDLRGPSLSHRPPTVVQILGTHSVSDARELVAEAVASVPSCAVLLLFGDMAVAGDGGARTATMLRELAVLTVGRPTIAVLPLVASSEMVASFEALTEGARASDEHSAIAPPDEPLMLIGADRTAFWWGIEGDARAVLSKLAADAGFATPPHLLEGADEPPTMGSLAAADRAEWLQHAFSGGTTLALSANDVETALELWIRQRLDEQIATGGGGVSAGDRLVGTLDTVGRYVDLRSVLDATRTTRLAGQIVANAIRDRLTDSVALVVALPDVPDDYLSSVCSAIKFDGRTVRIDPTTVGWRLAPPPEARPGKALIIAGVRFTGETLRAAAEELVRWGITPQLIAIALDASTQPDGPLHALDATVPVYSLCKFDIPAAALSVDELSARPAPPSVEDEYPISPAHFGVALARSGSGFALVHIERTSDRHLVGYYNMREVLADEELRAQLVATLETTVRRLAGGVENDGHVVLYPADDLQVAGALARELAGLIGPARLGPLARGYGSAYTADGGLWALRDVATFVDWGVVTARTARSALSRLVAAGAAKAIVIAIASQLDPEEETYLRRTTSVRRRAVSVKAGELPAVGSGLNEEVQVAFECLTHITRTVYSRQTCPLCVALRELTAYARDAPLPILRAHAAEKVELLRPRSRDEALVNVQDLYGSQLAREDRSEIIQLWHDLDACTSDNGARWRLYQRLTEGSRGEREPLAIALCRILAARHDLLHSPPLSYARFREAVADLSADLLSATRHSDAGKLSSPIRRQAIVALRSASKERFIDELPSIVRDNFQSPAVLGQAWLSVYSILERRYFHGTATMGRLYKALVACEALLTSTEVSDYVDEEELQSVGFLKRTAHTLANRGDVEDSTHIAWQALRQGYGAQVKLHHHAINKLGQIVRSLNDLVTHTAIEHRDVDANARVLQRLNALWRHCGDFLAYAVLPSLPTVRTVLGASYYQEQVAHGEDWQRWSALLGSNATEEDLVFSRLLAALTATPESFDESARIELLSQAEWLARFFLPLRSSPKADNLVGRRPALLFTWLEECPVTVEQVQRELSHALIEAVQNRSVNIRPSVMRMHIDMDEPVFCPMGLVREVAEAIGDNIFEHQHLATNLQITMRLDMQGDALRFTSVSHGSVRADRASRRQSRTGGLNGLVRRLDPFGGELEWGVENLEDFATHLVLPRLDLVHGRP